MEVIQGGEGNGYSDGKVYKSEEVGQNLEQYNFILLQIGAGCYSGTLWILSYCFYFLSALGWGKSYEKFEERGEDKE